MISKIRVEARSYSMQEAESEIEGFIAHAKLAGYFEGIVPSVSHMSDHHFGMPQNQKVDTRDSWDELGLGYEGRIVYTFEPERIDPSGGLRQGGFEVTSVEDFTPHGLAGVEGSEKEPVRTDVSEDVIVLRRQRDATRDHSWDGSSNYTDKGEHLSSHNRCREALVNNQSVDVWWRGESFEKATSLVGYVTPETGPYGTSTAKDILYQYEVELREDADREKEADRVLEQLVEWARSHGRSNFTWWITSPTATTTTSTLPPTR